MYDVDYVEVDRTGMAHSSPGPGEEVFARGQDLRLELFCPFRSDGL